MCIGDIMDCQDCGHLKIYPGRTGGDPDQCYPDESICEKGALEGGEPCARILGAIRDLINDGEMKTEHGQFYTGACLQDDQDDECMSDSFRRFNFSSALYYWVPDNFDIEYIKAYQDEKEVFYDWFI